jgi:purine-nucleoside phosphorylase
MNIIDNFKKYCNVTDVLQGAYGISSSTKYDCVVIAPAWEIKKVFDIEQYNPTLIAQNKSVTAHQIQHNGKLILYAELHVGAPNMIDFCLACCDLECDKFIFVGSAGSIVKEVSIGDIIIPSTSISAEGASSYLYETLSRDGMFKKSESNTTLNQQIRQVCDRLGVTYQDQLVISVDSVLAEYSHLDELRETGATVVEMETSVFFKTMQLLNKRGSAILVISDNSACGQSLVGSTEEQYAKYSSSRKNLCQIITTLLEN